MLPCLAEQLARSPCRANSHPLSSHTAVSDSSLSFPRRVPFLSSLRAFQLPTRRRLFQSASDQISRKNAPGWTRCIVASICSPSSSRQRQTAGRQLHRSAGLCMPEMDFLVCARGMIVEIASERRGRISGNNIAVIVVRVCLRER